MMKILQKDSLLTNEKGPAIRAEFCLGEKGIEKISLTFKKSGCFEWCFSGTNPKPAMLDLIKEWVESYCKGRQPDIILPIMFKGLPPYTTQVLSILRDIPFGLSLTYQALAEISGNPKGARAVGNACARNPFPLIIPCHRVLASNNQLGGFSGGPEIKKCFLNFEGIPFKVRSSPKLCERSI